MYPLLIDASSNKSTYSRTVPFLSYAPRATRAQSISSSTRRTEGTYRLNSSCTNSTGLSGSCWLSRTYVPTTHAPTSPSRSVHWVRRCKSAQHSCVSTPGLQLVLSRLATLACTHRTHTSNVGGVRGNRGWLSASHSAYPPDLNMIIANAIASRITLTSGAPKPAQPTPSPPAPVAAHTPSANGSAPPVDDAGAADNAAQHTRAPNDAHNTNDVLRQHFQRGRPPQQNARRPPDGSQRPLARHEQLRSGRCLCFSGIRRAR
eukprot:6054697-Pleurochrysis_carterae.AAC.4